jgi:CubicO group peptidase (beta-lactamase class C family)
MLFRLAQGKVAMKKLDHVSSRGREVGISVNASNGWRRSALCGVLLLGGGIVATAEVCAAQLVPSPDADAKYALIEKSIYLYEDEPYTIAGALAKNEVAGLSVVLIHDGKPALHRTYGLRVKKKNLKTDDATRYQCASTSKMVSALGIVTAARQGKLQLDQPITEFNKAHPDALLAEWVDKYFKDEAKAWAKDVTLRRLLSHSAGMGVHGISDAPWLPSNDPLKNILFGRSIFKDPVKPIHEPGTMYDYSGGGYIVAEQWLETATGTKFKDYLKQNVLNPLGMTQSTFETANEDTPNLAWGCSRGVCLYNVRTLDVKAAGGLICHPVDYARLVALMMNQGKDYLPGSVGIQRIPADDVVTMLSPSKDKNTGTPIPSGGEWYGLGVSLRDDLGADGLTTRFKHGGAHQGFAIEFYADRTVNAGIVVLVNGDGEWWRQKEKYGGHTMADAVVTAFKVAYGIINSAGPLVPRCSGDGDCGPGQYCNAGIDTKHNECVALKVDNEGCDLVNGGRQCKSGRCKAGRCYTPDSVAMGGTCYVNDACKEGKCSSLDGTKGTCVCKEDSDCAAGKWCNAGLDATKNACLALKNDNETCDIAGGGHQCKSGRCRVSRCYTPSSVPMGGTCYVDDACKEGKCSSLDGTKGTCVCKEDSDCGAGKWCNGGVDATKNVCVALKNNNETCDLVGGGHQCKSGQCKFSRCYTPSSVPMGGTCYMDDACKEGKCSAVDGAKGTCVCKKDSDCGAGKWCDGGIDAKINVCRAKLNKGEKCGKVGSIGNDHKCKSGECSGAPSYKCK